MGRWTSTKVSLQHFIFYMWFLMDLFVKTNICDAIGLDRMIIDSFQNYSTLALVIIYCIYGVSYSKRDLLIIAFVGLGLAISGVRSSSYVLISAFLFMILVKNASIDDIVRVVYKVLCFLIPLTVLLYSVGTIDGGNIYRYSRVRYGLGFAHPNTFGWAVLELLCCRFYLHKDRLRYIDYLIPLAMIPVLYHWPNSLSAVVGTVMLLILMVVYSISENKTFFREQVVAKALMIIGLLSNIYSVYFTVNSVSKYRITHLLDRFASSRLFYSHKSYNMFGTTLWGQKISLKFAWQRGHMETYLDNSFATLLIRYGIVCYVGYTIVSFLIFKKLAKEDYALLMCFFLFYFMGIMNASVLSLGLNVFLLAFTTVLFDKE